MYVLFNRDWELSDLIVGQPTTNARGYPTISPEVGA